MIAPQLELPGMAKSMLEIYSQAGAHGAQNADVYAKLPGHQSCYRKVGKQERIDVAKRQVRWQQQTLKALGLLEKVPGQRGKWRVKASEKLDFAPPGQVLLAFSTKMGLAFWADCRSLFASINEPIACIVTSPPYPLRHARKYGNPDEHEFVDFICSVLEPMVKHMLPGASLMLNISNDIFEKGLPSRSMYVERTVLALHDRLGLRLMDRLIWENRCKLPGPIQWSSKTRQQLNVSYEHVLWMTNDPARCFADNRRILRPHSEKHRKLLAKGGESRSASYGDGAYQLKPGSFAQTDTQGTIARNIFKVPSNPSPEIVLARRRAAAMGLPMHGALMPLELASDLITFATEPGQLVADPFGGWWNTPLAAELTGRHWISSEIAAQYAAGGAPRFTGFEGFSSHHEVEAWPR